MRLLGNAFFQRLVDKSALRGVQTQPNLYRLDFVGLMACGHMSIFSMPKVYEASDRMRSPAEVSRILRCIQKYQVRVRRRRDPIGEASLVDDAGPLLNVFISLMAWTQAHGIHQQESISVSDRGANINWGYTFENSLVGHLRTGPIFADLYDFAETKSDSQLGLIQAIALTELHRSFGVVAELWCSRHDPLMEMCRDTISHSAHFPLHRDEMNVALTDAELHSTRDHDRELVSLLIDWLALTGKARDGFNLYGVNAFHTVWEDICNVAVQGDAPPVEHADIAAQAVFRFPFATTRLPNQRPDQILRRGDQIWIGDAKWYRPWRNEYPPLPDVIKQMMYSMTVDSHLDVKKNYFLLPTMQTPSVEDLGEASMIYGGMVDSRFPSVALFGAGWDSFLDRYLAPAGTDTLDEWIFSA